MLSSGFCFSSWLQSENERKQKYRQILGSWQRAEKAVEYEGDSDTNCNWCTWNSLQRLGKESGETENQSKNQSHPNHNIVKIY